jgi:hypothetical protein
MPERATRKRREQSAEVVVAEEKPAGRVPKAGRIRRSEGPNEEESESAVSLRRKVPQMSGRLELLLKDRGEAPNVQRSEEARPATDGNERAQERAA